MWEGFGGGRNTHGFHRLLDICEIDILDSVGKSLVVESEAVLHKSA